METVYIEHFDEVSDLQPEPCVMALGFFDGVHLGHRKVIGQARKISEKNKLKLAVMTFFPHPKEVFSSTHTKMNYLTPMDVKTEIFSELGVDKVYVINFTKTFAALSPEEFIQRFLVELGVVHVVAGYDFTYGYKGLGNMDTIQADGNDSFNVTTISKLEHGGKKISSTLIREMLANGEVHKITACLGSFYETRGKILSYLRRGKSGNLRLEIIKDPYFTLPKSGFYEIEVQIGEHTYHGTAHICTPKTCTLEIDKLYQINSTQELEIKIKWLDQLIVTNLLAN